MHSYLLLFVLAALAASAEPVRFREVRDLIDREKPGTVERLLEKLPKAIFNDFVLMRSSESQQSASPKAPRVVLFGGGGDLVLAYGGEGSNLEAIEFDRKTRKWNFYKVDFEKSPPAVSKANPTECKRCHQGNSRPNWHPYAFWPGAYGEDESLSGSEKERFAQFVKESGKAPRYRRLPMLASHYDRLRRLPEPNTRFTVTLARRNFERIAAELSARSDFANIKYALAAACIPGCIKVGEDGSASLDFLPAESEIRRRAEKQLTDSLKAQKEKSKITRGLETLAVLAVLEAAGRSESLGNWTMSFGSRGSYKPKRGVFTLDPLAHGLGGGSSLLPWGLAAIDKDIATLARPFLGPRAAKIVVPPDESAGARRTRELAMPLLTSPQLIRGKAGAACLAFSRKSREALEGFSPPDRERKKSSPIATH